AEPGAALRQGHAIIAVARDAEVDHAIVPHLAFAQRGDRHAALRLAVRRRGGDLVAVPRRAGGGDGSNGDGGWQQDSHDAPPAWRVTSIPCERVPEPCEETLRLGAFVAGLGLAEHLEQLALP